MVLLPSIRISNGIVRALFLGLGTVWAAKGSMHTTPRHCLLHSHATQSPTLSHVAGDTPEAREHNTVSVRFVDSAGDAVRGLHAQHTGFLLESAKDTPVGRCIPLLYS